MLIEEDVAQLRDFLLQRCQAQVRSVSAGVLWWVIESAASEASNLEEAKDLAQKTLNEIANREREIPLAIQEMDYCFDPGRVNDPARPHTARVKAIPNKVVKGQPLIEHLAAALEMIQGSSYLLRKISEAEAKAFLDLQQIATSLEHVFPEGKEGAKAFAIARVFKFGSGERNKLEGAYDYCIYIQLTQCFKDYLCKYLWVNEYKVQVGDVKENFR
jgi:hypothetical protein